MLDLIKEELLSKILELTKTVEIKVMMGDSTITEQKTFDPKQVINYLEKLNKNLIDWSLQDVSITNNEDLRRIFTKFEITEGNYLISGHISLQFHVLLFYKPLQRVIDCQKELAEIVDTTNEVVRRALASALQRDGLVHSLGDGFRLLENCVVDYMHCGYLEGELQYIVCSSEGETRYGDFVEKPLEITLIEI